MKHKALVLGPQLSGKSTLIKHLRATTSLNILEMDEEILQHNSNHWPDYNAYKEHVLVPKIIDEILSEEEVIFFASFIPWESFEKFKSHGFTLIELVISLKEIRKRNENRVATLGTKDAMPWIPGELEEVQYLEHSHLFSYRINAEQTTELMAADLLQRIGNK